MFLQTQPIFSSEKKSWKNKENYILQTSKEEENIVKKK